MVLIIISWLWIGIASFLLGFAVMQAIGKVTGEEETRCKLDSVEIYILMGLVCLTVYSQVFSLVAGIGFAATIIAGVLCLVVAIAFWQKIKQYFIRLFTQAREIKFSAILFLMVLLLFVLLAYITASRTWHYDTDLYHAQAIRWIEEFGVVKGLGNLHNRFAYNSAFFCLQALFSMKFAVNQSLHSVNGFITFLMLSYALCTLSVWKRERLKISDFMKIGLFIYFGYLENSLLISSPGSDILTMCMVLYVSAKWAELLERGEKSPVPYGILCLLSVWTVTVKLSAAFLVFLAIYPAVLLMRQKKWKHFIMFVIMGVGIVVPFLIRNVIISGYLVYPYSEIDLFDVDWKMAASVAADDSREIMAWGRGMTSRPLYDAGFRTWFPKWYDTLSMGTQGLFIANIVCMVFLMGYLAWVVLKKSRGNGASVSLLLVSMAQVIMWFVTAPLLRYGLAYMLLLPAFLAGLVCQKINSRIIAWVICVSGICCGISRMVQVADDFTEPHWKRPADYNWKERRTVVWENMEIYVPDGSDSIGYHFFPSTPNEARLEAIELRTENLADGFRLKADYRDKVFNSSGVVIERFLDIKRHSQIKRNLNEKA